MKIALCLYGKVGGVEKIASKEGAPSDPRMLEIGHSLYSQNLSMADVYLHSWSDDFRETILSLYKPVRHIIEPQKDIKTQLSGKQGANEFIIRSRMYSQSVAFNLTPKTYDLYIVSRFDVMWKITNLNLFNVNKLNLSNMCGYGTPSDIFSFPCNKLEDDHCHYDPESHGISDFWFAGNYNTIEKLCQLHEHFDLCLQQAPKKPSGTPNPHKMIWWWCKHTGLDNITNFIHCYKDVPLIRRELFWKQQ